MRRRRPAIKGCDIVIAMPGKLEQLTLWTGVDETLGNMAIGQVRDSLMAFLKNERGIHVESLMVALGALAGHASLHAAFAVAAADPGKASLMTVETRDGATFYAGDTLNAFLIPENPEIVSLWGLIAASALALGVPQAELPGYVDISAVPQAPWARRPSACSTSRRITGPAPRRGNSSTPCGRRSSGCCAGRIRASTTAAPCRRATGLTSLAWWRGSTSR
jgi:hypothetical protein